MSDVKPLKDEHLQDGVLTFEGSLESIHFKINDKIGNTTHYILREATGEARNVYLSHIAKNVDISTSETGSGRIKSFEKSTSKLLNQCVFEKVPPKDWSQDQINDVKTDEVLSWGNKDVSIEELDKWANRITDNLFKRCLKISHLETEQRSKVLSDLLKDQKNDLTDEEVEVIESIIKRLNKEQTNEAKN